MVQTQQISLALLLKISRISLAVDDSGAADTVTEALRARSKMGNQASIADRFLGVEWN